MISIGFDSALFANKTVVITGAGRGIGLEIAKQFRQTGARIIAHSGRAGTQNRLDDIADHAIEADFSTPDGAAQFAAQVKAKTAQIDVLINNAGTMLGRFPADEISDAEYAHIVALNQTSVVMLTRSLIPLFSDSGGSIINTVSISAKTGGSPGSSIYSATKAFVATYSKALARELAPKNIRVNAISPGTIETEFHERYSTKEKLEATRKSIPLGRLGTAADCAPSYLFLAAPQLSGFITGQVIEINGGQLIA